MGARWISGLQARGYLSTGLISLCQPGRDVLFNIRRIPYARYNVLEYSAVVSSERSWQLVNGDTKGGYTFSKFITEHMREP